MAQVCKCRDRLQRLCVHSNRYPAGFKAVLQNHPYDPELLHKPTFFELIMPVPEATCRYLTTTPLTFGKRGGVFLQYTETVTPVLRVKMVPQAVPDPGGTREDKKGAWSLRRALQ